MEYAFESLEIYNDYVSPALGSHDFAKCVSTAFDEEAKDLNALLEDQPLPLTGEAIGSALNACAGEAAANMIKGPWGLAF